MNRLKDRKKVYRSSQGGKVYARLAEGVKPRSYTRRELKEPQQYTEQEIADEAAENTGPEHEVRSQSFDPQVMAEMAATGASYTEAWDS